MQTSLGVLLATGLFVFMFGRFPLYLQHVGWIYAIRGDPAQQQISWEFFRQNPWRFPLGRIESYGYPMGTTVTSSGGIPLADLPMKVISPLLPPRIQYAGAWVLLALVGQALVGVFTLAQFTKSLLERLLGAALLVLSPPLLFRVFYHEAFTAHWILTSAFLFIILEHRRILWRGAWPVLFAIALMVYPYFVGLLLPLWVVGLVIHYGQQRTRWPILIEVAALPAVLALVAYIIGLFTLDLGDAGAGGYGHYSWNLNGFWNPLQTSAFLEPLPTGTWGQYEGYSYLGLGNMLLLPIAIILFVVKDRARLRLPLFSALGVALILYAIFALSNRAFFNDRLLWEFEVPSALNRYVSLFRSSGRFSWPVFYALVFFALISLVRNVRPAAPLLLAAVLLQLIDLEPLYASKRLNGFIDSDGGRLQGEFWDAAGAVSRHVVMIPAIGVPSSYERTALFALEHHLTLNTGYLYPVDQLAIESYAREAWESLKAGRADPDTIYLFYDGGLISSLEQELPDRTLICNADGYGVALAPSHALGETPALVDAYCAGP